MGAGIHKDGSALHALDLLRASGVPEADLLEALLAGKPVAEPANIVFGLDGPRRPDDWTLLVIGRYVLTLAPYDAFQLDQVGREGRDTDPRGPALPPDIWRSVAMDGTVTWELWNVRIRQIAPL